jgi:hypothetical protein
MENKVIERIQKLLSLSESSNENEAKLAMLKAQELLAKHKLSMQEVKNIKLYNSKIKDHVSNVSFTKAKWKGRLANIIANNFGCYNYFKTRRVNTITFYGREEDVIVCNIVLQYAIDCIEANTKKIQYAYSRNGYSTKGVANDYAIGFIDGLNKNFEEQKKANQEWGLVLVKDKEVVEAYSQKKFKGSISTKSKFQGHTEIYYQGVEDGEKFSISDKITEGDSDDIPILEVTC